MVFQCVQTSADQWTIEIAIPFKTLRFKSENREWGINFIRGRLQNQIVIILGHLFRYSSVG